jgi:hypothetical protein
MHLSHHNHARVPVHVANHRSQLPRRTAQADNMQVNLP